jgi:hypothetical protein
MHLSEDLERLDVAANRLHWPEHLAESLGQMPDAELAALLRVHPHTVAAERRRRGIVPYSPRRTAVEWTEEMIAALGTDSDRNIARELGLTPTSVYRKRRLLRIAPFQPPPVHKRRRRTDYPWPPEAIAMLGTMPDRDVAKHLGLSAHSVQLKRRLLGIRSYRPALPRIDWTPPLLALLGKLPDAEVAKRFGMSSDSIKHKRDELRIPPYVEQPKPLARSAKLAALLKLPNRDVLRQAGISESTLRKLRRQYGIKAPDTRNWRWRPETIARLGKEPDARIAEDLGIRKTAVSQKRRSLGIVPTRKLRPWTQEELALLGTASDRQIAERIGRTLFAVKRMRQMRGIRLKK